jgi:hypothetical protein
MADQQETPVVVAPKVAAPKVQPKEFVNKITSNWNITPTEVEEEITALNSVTNEYFEGTIVEFNRLLEA